jgi:glycosyltransferase involved in cell wall biosynthesis
MRDIDWTIIPSTWWENAPVVIQEAFHHGRPIIASNIGGMAEKVTDDVDGLHFHVSNPESLAEQMARAIQDPSLWERLRSGIRKQMTANEAGRQHVELFDELIRRKSAIRDKPPGARLSA